MSKGQQQYGVRPGDSYKSVEERQAYLYQIGVDASAYGTHMVALAIRRWEMGMTNRQQVTMEMTGARSWFGEQSRLMNRDRYNYVEPIARWWQEKMTPQLFGPTGEMVMVQRPFASPCGCTVTLTEDYATNTFKVGHGWHTMSISFHELVTMNSELDFAEAESRITEWLEEVHDYEFYWCGGEKPADEKS